MNSVAASSSTTVTASSRSNCGSSPCQSRYCGVAQKHPKLIRHFACPPGGLADAMMELASHSADSYAIVRCQAARRPRVERIYVGKPDSGGGGIG